jgi:radical SAM protein with 4Fe4S-binding SPASM domain
MGFYKKEQITFLLTTACNLGCYYCYMPKMQGAGLHQAIDVEFAKIGLNDFFASSRSRCVRFFAPGEPTLAFQQMQEIWHHAKELAGEQLVTELETNGYFGDATFEWIENHVDCLWISCDGPPAIHDLQRPTLGGLKSSTTVHSNIERAARNSRMQVGVRATVDTSWLGRQVDLVEYFHRLGVKYLAASPCYYSSQNPRVITPSLQRFAEGFVPAYYRARELGMWYLTLMIVNFDEPVDIYCQASIPTPRLTTDGYVSCCDWAAFGTRTSVGPHGKDLIYGEYVREEKKIRYDREKIEKIRMRNVTYLGANHCKACRALKHCAGGCIGKVMASTGDLYEPLKGWCDAVQFLFDRLPVNKEPFPVLHP